MNFVFDLDGTICTQEKSEDYYKAKPIKRVVNIMRSIASDKENKIIIYTARGMVTFKGSIQEIRDFHYAKTVEWLLLHEVPFNELHFGKPAGDIFIDDKGINVRDFKLPGNSTT